MDKADELKLALRAVIFVPKGTVAVMLFPEIVAVIIGDNPSKLKAVMSFAELFGCITLTFTLYFLVTPF